MTTPDWVTIATLQAIISQARELVDELLGVDRVIGGDDRVLDSTRVALLALQRLLDLPEEMLKQ